MGTITGDTWSHVKKCGEVTAGRQTAQIYDIQVSWTSRFLFVNVWSCSYYSYLFFHGFWLQGDINSYGLSYPDNHILLNSRLKTFQFKPDFVGARWQGHKPESTPLIRHSSLFADNQSRGANRNRHPR